MTLSRAKLTLKFGVHNYPLAEYLESHSYAERLLESETFIVIEMSKYHVRPRNILTLLKQKNLKNESTMKIIYNAHHKYKVIEQREISDLTFVI